MKRGEVDVVESVSGTESHTGQLDNLDDFDRGSSFSNSNLKKAPSQKRNLEGLSQQQATYKVSQAE